MSSDFVMYIFDFVVHLMSSYCFFRTFKGLGYCESPCMIFSFDNDECITWDDIVMSEQKNMSCYSQVVGNFTNENWLCGCKSATLLLNRWGRVTL